MNRVVSSLLFTATIALSSVSFAQSNLLNAKTPDMVGKLTEDQEKFDNDEPLEYGFVGDRDVLWAQIVWEKIDLNQKVNFPLFFPTKQSVINKNRRPLFTVLVDAIKDGLSDNPSPSAITQIFATDYFDADKRIEGDEVLNFLKYTYIVDVGLPVLDEFGIVGTEAQDTYVKRYQAGTLDQYYPAALIERMDPYIETVEIVPSDIDFYYVKGMWYFDKRQGELRYRLLAIAPVGADVKTKGTAQQEPVVYFWLWYPDARKALHEAKVLNKNNSAKPISFDHLLNSRRFDSMIYKTENEYGDREIENYIPDNAMMQLLESDRIKEKIRNFELDMWNH